MEVGGFARREISISWLPGQDKNFKWLETF